MKNRRAIYKGRVIEVWQENKLLPNGRRVRLDIVRHPGAVLIAPFLHPDRIILLKQFRPVVNAYLYELPAGTIDKGETPLVCARREVIEETGFSAAKFKLLGKIYPVPGYSTEKISIYKAQELTRKVKAGDPDEIIECYVFNKAEVRRLFKKGRIIDAKTIVGLAWCGWI